MKVGNNNAERLSQLQQTQTQASAEKKAGSAGETAQRAAGGVPVTVSNSARSLDVHTRTQGDVDLAKVRAMREAIANGTFSINAGTIADKLLADAGDFLQPAAR